ncbi:sugar transporter-domain-containing protein [Xylaria telfairii]|nr:sugar transporter-domain-containing protein [Xylaria telfairii]
MADQQGSSLSHAMYVRDPPTRHLGLGHDIELGVRSSGVSIAQDSYQAKGHQRRNNYQVVIEGPLARLTDEELEEDARAFQRVFLPHVKAEQLLRAVQVAKDIRIYDAVARSEDPNADRNLPVKLTTREKVALKKERDSLPSETTMLIVVLTVSLAAFLQGFVQSSINGASLYAEQFGLATVKPDMDLSPSKPTANEWKLGAVNAAPFLFAALVGCWLALPINERFGRRGAMAIAACLILASSLGSAFCGDWKQLFGVRVFNGIGQSSPEISIYSSDPEMRSATALWLLANGLTTGMGIKAVSTPILASETAVGYWRGTSILAWQLWVAFGIAMGFAFNLIFYTAENDAIVKGLILGAPFVPSIFLLVSLYFCPESPRYYMRQRSAHFDPEKAYGILLRLRGCELQALRDIYLIYKSVQQEEQSLQSDEETANGGVPQGVVGHLRNYITQYKQLFTRRRLRNALVSSSIVALAQQLCGINIFTIYSGPLFSGLLQNSTDKLYPLVYSLVFGIINFIFGLPAIRTIDTLGRRKWLVLTLPLMCLLMTAAALSTLIPDSKTRGGIVALFVFLFAIAYSPGMGPVPFTLASESFPLSHREAGCAFAIATNLGFAGLLSIFFPSIYAGLHDGGTLGLFAGLNLVAFLLVFLLVEETKRRSLEDLNGIFDVRKSRFTRYQVVEYLPWFFRRYVLGRQVPRPELYLDLIWGDHNNPTDHRGGDVVEDGDIHEPDKDINAGGQGLFNQGSPFDTDARRAELDDDHW